MKVTTSSPFDSLVRVELDPYGPNPLAEAARQHHAAYEVARAKAGPPPTLFTGGNLPTFTASGVSPATLSKLPYTWRHHAAALADTAQLYELFERGQEPEAWIFDYPHPGLSDAITRMRSWLVGAMDRDRDTFARLR